MAIVGGCKIAGFVEKRLIEEIMAEDCKLSITVAVKV